MSEPWIEAIQTIPIRGRAAFALAVAERVSPVLSSDSEAMATARGALDEAWRWANGADIRAAHLYDRHVENLAVQGSRLADRDMSGAMCAVISAFYYVMWHAFGIDLAKRLVAEGDVPNDIAEVGEDVIEEVCEEAAETSLYDKAWVASVAMRLAGDFRSDYPEELGPSVPREYFA